MHKFWAEEPLGLGQDGWPRTTKGRFLGLTEGGFLKTQNLTLEIKGSNEQFCDFSNVVNVPHEGGGVKIDFVVKPLDFKGGIFGSEIA